MPFKLERAGTKEVRTALALAAAAISIAGANGAHANELNFYPTPANPKHIKHLPIFGSKTILRSVIADMDDFSKYVAKEKKIEKHKSTNHTLTPEQFAKKAISHVVFTEWEKVNVCEEGGKWHISGATYSGGLGINHHNWIAYGGDYFNVNEADATPIEQVYVADKIQHPPPDQNGCQAGGW